MIVSVLYPNTEGATFDAAYYKDVHAELARDIWKPEKIELIEGHAIGGATVPFRLIAHFHFASPEALGAAMTNPRVGELQADVPNFTNITPTLMTGYAL
jgi:uncharacterized protein (TIGR02118 family)